MRRFLRSRFHYHVRKKNGDRADLIFRVTDTLIYEGVTTDINADMLNLREMEDLSNYPPTHPKSIADFVLTRAKVRMM